MAVYYLDSSALVKRYVREVGSTWVLALTDPNAAQNIYVVSITGPEIIAAFFRKVRTQEINLEDASRGAENFKADFRSQYQIVQITSALIDSAMTLAQQNGIRGYDAMQLAAASELHAMRIGLGATPLTFISADSALNGVAESEGLAVDDPNAHD